MAGTSEGNKKAAQTTKLRHGQDFYKKAGAKSWENPNRSRKTGFALNPELAREAGRKGGLKQKVEYEEEDPKKVIDFLTKEIGASESQ